ncbi:response regulator transcription factor [Deinococcus aquiradiocola]|uniref:DNA-binding response regulator n=1 Tax=Deinococcus aquiradiocola TaxID=393059 RepID=A0A917ULG3_9DEIO|nr:response regulator transcription factor [Deinococcus aquiradiocola]GGJ66686.1 DNA-binding response regulator [Deinococcus aquiradiocola]
MLPLVLVVEDEPDIAATVGRYLERADLRVELAHDGPAALSAFERVRPALIVLDLMLPGLSGWEVLRAIRLLHDTPVIALTARVTQEDRLEGFALGADDYVTKPFYPQELVSRVKAVLRRSGVNGDVAGRGGLSIQVQRRRVLLGTQTLELRPTEFAMLLKLVSAPGRVFSRSELLLASSDEPRDTLERTVDVHIRNLRLKLGADHGIETVFGVGYRYATH